MKIKTKYYLLGLIILIALFVRLKAINHGLPDIMYVDAQKTVGVSKRITWNILNGKFDIDPKQYQYPTLFLNLLAAEFTVYAVSYALIGNWQGRFKSFSEAVNALYTPKGSGYLYQAVPSVFYLIARITNALAGVLTVFFVFLVGAKAFKDDRIGLCSALFLALMFFHVKDSRYPMTDSMMALMSAIALYYIACLNHDGGLKNYLLAGTFIGLGVSTKYLPGFLVIPFLVVMGFRWWDEHKTTSDTKKLYGYPLSGLIMIPISFIIGTPIILVRFSNYFGRYSKQLAAQSGGKLGFTQSWYFDYLFSRIPSNYEPLAIDSFWGAMGLSILILLIFGIIYALYRGFTNRDKIQPLDIGFALVIICYYIFLAGPGNKRIIRYFYFLYPLFCIMAARFLVDVFSRIKFLKGKGWILLCLSILFVLPTGIRTFRYVYLLSHTNTRIESGQWIEKHIKPGTRIFAPILYPPCISSTTYKIFYYRGENMDIVPNIEMLKRAGFEYVITSSYDSIVYFYPDSMREQPELVSGWKKFYLSLDESLSLAKQFENNLIDKPGPEIKIYKL
ncbi:MAG: ArnT family glycosyltransferase [bacterium]